MAHARWIIERSCIGDDGRRAMAGEVNDVDDDSDIHDEGMA